MKVIVVRAGSARLFSAFGTRHVSVGDIVLLSANTLCGAEPENWISTTTIYMDQDYLIDQVFWQHAAQFRDRLDASEFLRSHLAEPAQILRIGEERAGLLMPWLDELAALSGSGLGPERFLRAQALLFSVLDVVVPLFAVLGQRTNAAQRGTAIPAYPRHRRLQPLRPEAHRAAEMLRGDVSRRWTVQELAQAVHLSPSQLRRVFVNGFGKTPIAYLTMLRIERMARLLGSTAFSVARIAESVGWGDADFASRQFRRSLGVPPSAYRPSACPTKPREE
jgi:AraC-like DNA-binding protein